MVQVDHPPTATSVPQAGFETKDQRAGDAQAMLTIIPARRDVSTGSRELSKQAPIHLRVLEEVVDEDTFLARLLALNGKRAGTGRG